ncbi:monocarboxylate permease-like protein, partial [Aureobasidium melanogenum]
MAAQQHNFETQSSHSSFHDTVMGSKPELLRLEQGEKGGKFDGEKGAVATAERPALGDDGQRDAVATPPPAFDPRDNPDGGRDAWLVVLGAFCCMFCSFGWINCIGVFQEYYETHQLRGDSPSTVSWIPSMETFLMFFLGPFIGYFFDSYGPRYILLTGTCLHVFGVMMASLAKDYYQIMLSQGICSAAGASMCFYPAMSVMPTWFFKKRAAAFGIMAAGSSTGGVIFPIMVNKLIPRIGFGWTMRVCGFLILALMLVANATVKSRLPPRPKPFHIVQFIRPLKETPYLLTVLGSFFFFFAMFLPINYLILQAETLGMSSRLAEYLVPILNGASFFGRVLPGVAADKIGRYNVMSIMMAFAGILILALWLPAASNAPIIVFAALYGFGSGSFVSLAPSLVAQISDVREIGVRNGTVFAIISFAALCSNPIGGALITHWDGKYTGLQIFGGIMALSGACTILAARIVLAGTKIATKV